MASNSYFTFRGNRTREISFPLGGVGTGSISLAGNGRLIDWEIFNRPNKGSVNGFSHFAIKVEKAGEVLDARILHGDLHPPYSGIINGALYNAFGFGVPREYLTGLPHFKEVVFQGEFPFAELEYLEPDFPGKVKLLAFNPFIPLNEFDSGIPAAFFEFEVANPTAAPLTYELRGSLSNPLPPNQRHAIFTEQQRTYLLLSSDYTVDGSGHGAYPGGKGISAKGDLTLAVESQGDAQAELLSQGYWFRGAWFDSLEIYWREMTQAGGLKPRSYAADQAGANNAGSLSSRFTLQPGETQKVRFVIAWSFPYNENDWNENTNQITRDKGLSTSWKNYYATRFENSYSAACYALDSWERLYGETLTFKQALYNSTLDDVVIDAVASNLAVLKSPTVMRLEDGTFYGFEGCHPNAGCCEGSCTHVWNYTQATPFLFPALERSMRAVDFKLNQRQDGGMRFRLPLPANLSAEDYWVFHPCADGQFGNVLKAYADWKISGDTGWLKKYWPAIVKAIEFAWEDSNEYRWDPEQKGVLTGRMHHTLDMELFGPDAWLNGFYLAALKAGAEMAEALEEPERADTYRKIFARGKAWVDQNLFNGEYYHQIVDLKDQANIDRFGVSDIYWDAEHGEVKYQIGEGCEIDQLLAQWHANLYGLGEIFDPDQARTALKSLYKYNFKQNMRAAYNPCRVFALDDEAGLVMCAWPAGKPKPMIPVPYSQEVMTGFEYAAATLMIQSGLVKEGMDVVRAIRARYDGEKRNPWNEIECGSNYARALSSYALLLTFSGFQFDQAHKQIGFNPIQLQHDQYQCFWSLDCGWGTYQQQPELVILAVQYGQLEVQHLRLPFLAPGEIKDITLDGISIPFEQNQEEVVFKSPVWIKRKSNLTLRRS